MPRKIHLCKRSHLLFCSSSSSYHMGYSSQHSSWCSGNLQSRSSVNWSLLGWTTSNQDGKDPAFHFPQPREATSTHNTHSHMLQNLLVVSRNGHPENSSFPTPRNTLWVSPKDVPCLLPIASQLLTQEKASNSSILPDWGVGIILLSYLSPLQLLCLYSSAYVLLVWSVCYARWHRPTREDHLGWSIRFPEIKQPNSFPHLSIPGFSVTNAQVIWHKGLYNVKRN